MHIKDGSQNITRKKNYYPYLLAIVFFIVYKIIYPNPELTLDSVNYIQWGLTGARIGFRPLGYTHFLMLFNGLKYNYLTIIVLQFLVLLASTYYFLETIFDLFRPSKGMQWLYQAMILFNPFYYYITNLLTADPLFISISLLWIAFLLNAIFSQRKKHLFLTLHIMCLIPLFFLRYNGMYYPFFTIAVLLFCPAKPSLKITGIAANLCVFFLLYSIGVNTAKREVGVKTLSGFGGWSIANNAIHIYNVTKVDSTIFHNEQEVFLNHVILTLKDSAFSHEYWDGVTDQYMWKRNGPLKQYLYSNLRFHKEDTAYIQSWWRESTFYFDFGIKLIRHYPFAFLKSFYWPNIKRFIFPYTFEMVPAGTYEIGLPPEQVKYLGVADTKLIYEYSAAQNKVYTCLLYLYALLSSICIIYCLFVVVAYVGVMFRTKFRMRDTSLTTAFIVASFYLLTMALLVFAHPIHFRYIALLLIFFSMFPFISYKVWIRRPASTEDIQSPVES